MCTNNFYGCPCIPDGIWIPPPPIITTPTPPAPPVVTSSPSNPQQGLGYVVTFTSSSTCAGDPSSTLDISFEECYTAGGGTYESLYIGGFRFLDGYGGVGCDVYMYNNEFCDYGNDGKNLAGAVGIGNNNGAATCATGFAATFKSFNFICQAY